MEDGKIGKVEKLETRENRSWEKLDTKHYMPWRVAKGLYIQCTDCVELATSRPRVHDKRLQCLKTGHHLLYPHL